MSEDNRTEEIRIYRPGPRLEHDAPVILTVIANWLQGDRVLALAAFHRIYHAFITPGRGTVRIAALRAAGVTDPRKEIVTLETTRSEAYAILEELKSEMNLEAEQAGIAFLRRTLTYENAASGLKEKEIAVMDAPLRAIYVVVDKGFAEDVILAGERSGTAGATIIPARGGDRPGAIPGMVLPEDREMVLIITSSDKSLRFLDTCRQDEVIMSRGKGIVFVMEILDSVGIGFY